MILLPLPLACDRILLTACRPFKVWGPLSGVHSSRKGTPSPLGSRATTPYTASLRFMRTAGTIALRKRHLPGRRPSVSLLHSLDPPCPTIDPPVRSCVAPISVILIPDTMQPCSLPRPPPPHRRAYHMPSARGEAAHGYAHWPALAHASPEVHIGRTTLAPCRQVPTRHKVTIRGTQPCSLTPAPHTGIPALVCTGSQAVHGAHGHEGVHYLLRHLRARLLVPRHQVRQHGDQLLLNLAWRGTFKEVQNGTGLRVAGP